MTILLIDDSPAVREVLRVAMESEGYRVLEAPDGKRGVRVCREHRPALVLVDIVMPEKASRYCARSSPSTPLRSSSP